MNRRISGARASRTVVPLPAQPAVARLHPAAEEEGLALHLEEGQALLAVRKLGGGVLAGAGEKAEHQVEFLVLWQARERAQAVSKGAGTKRRGRRIRRCRDGAPWAPCTASPRSAPPPASARAPWPAAGGSSPPSASRGQRAPCRCARCCTSCPPRPRPPVTAIGGCRR